MCGKLLKYTKNCFTMLEMAYEVEKRLKDVKMAKICGKWLKYLRKG